MSSPDHDSFERLRFVIPAASSSYPGLESEHALEPYEILYSPRLQITEGNYYESMEEVPEGFRMSTAAEELAIQLGLERADKNPRTSRVFRELFGDRPLLQWTQTGLRVPRRRDPRKCEKDPRGRKYWPRIVLLGKQKAGEVMIPESGVVVEWDEVFGIPKITSANENDMKYRNHTTHFYFHPFPSPDGKEDMGIYRSGILCEYSYNGHFYKNCLKVFGWERWGLPVCNKYAFRLVKGQIPEISARHL